MGKELFPIYIYGIVADDITTTLQRKGWIAMSKGSLELHVHLMLCKPQRQDGYFMSEVIKFNAIELGKSDSGKRNQTFFGNLLQSLEDFHFKLAKFLVGNDEEVA